MAIVSAASATGIHREKSPRHHCIEEHSNDSAHGGYFEAFNRDWSPIEDMRLSAFTFDNKKNDTSNPAKESIKTNVLTPLP